MTKEPTADTQPAPASPAISAPATAAASAATRPDPAALDHSLVQALRALADPSRLRMAGLLASHPITVDELAEALGLPAGAVVKQLGRLREAGLVESRSRSLSTAEEHNLALRRLGELGRALALLAQTTGSADGMAPGPDGQPRPVAEAKILRSFFQDGRLSSVPAQGRKRLVVLRYLAQTVFPEDREYPEKEVNQLLALRHPDVASLRRYLVDHGFMSREGGRYRLRAVQEWPPSVPE